MRLHELRPPSGANRAKRRRGRGIGSGHGKTAGRGSKGQHARNTVRPGFEGGQMPLFRRLRKQRGVSKNAMPSGMFRKEYAVVNIEQLARLEAGAEVTPQLLLERRVIRKLGEGLRVLGRGEIGIPLTVKAHHFSASARAKLEAAGGAVEVI